MSFLSRWRFLMQLFSVLIAMISVGAPGGVALDDSQLVPLTGHIHPLAQARLDAGEAPSSLQMGALDLVIAKSPGLEEELDQLLMHSCSLGRRAVNRALMTYSEARPQVPRVPLLLSREFEAQRPHLPALLRGSNIFSRWRPPIWEATLLRRCKLAEQSCHPCLAASAQWPGVAR
jgi:hypothetical protein